MVETIPRIVQGGGCIVIPSIKRGLKVGRLNSVVLRFPMPFHGEYGTNGFFLNINECTIVDFIHIRIAGGRGWAQFGSEAIGATVWRFNSAVKR